MLEYLRTLLNTVVFEFGDIQIDFGEMIMLGCLLIMLGCYGIILLLVLDHKPKK